MDINDLINETLKKDYPNNSTAAAVDLILQSSEHLPKLLSLLTDHETK